MLWRDIKSVGLFRARWLVAVLFLGAIVLRLYHLGANAFWFDEVPIVLNKWGVDKMPSLVRLLDPLFCVENQEYLNLYRHGFIYYWQLLFNDTEFSLRLSSVLFSVLSMSVLYRIVKKRFSYSTACIAVFLMGLAPFHVYYAQELRAYAATAFLALWGAQALLAWLDKGKARHFFIYVVSNILNIYFHPGMATVSLGFMSVMFYQLRARQAWLPKAFMAHALIAVSTVPVILNMVPNVLFMFQKHFSASSSEFPLWAGRNISLTSLMFSLKNFSIGYNVEFFSVTGIVATLLYGFFLVVGGWFSRAHVPTQLFMALLILPAAVFAGVSMVKTSFVDRHIFASFPFFMALVAVGLSRLSRGWLVLVLVLMFTLNVLALRRYFANIFPTNSLQRVGIVKKQDFRDVIAFLAQHYRPGDMIAHTCKNSVFPAKLYIRQYSHDASLINEIDQGKLLFLSEGGKYLRMHSYVFQHPLSFVESESPRFELVRRPGRMWLFSSSFNFADNKQKDRVVVERLLKEGFVQEKHEMFREAEIYALVLYF